MHCTLYFVLESKVHGLLERAATMRDNIQAHAKVATMAIHDKLNSAQEEAPPEHEGERTG